MDFHSLSRRELQALCKKNKIPANITNVAMADALKALEIVEGLDEFMNQSVSDAPQSPASIAKELPATAIRATRRKTTKEGTQSAQLVNRSRCMTRKVLGGEMDQDKLNMNVLQSPAAPASRRRAGVSVAQESEIEKKKVESDVKVETDVPETPAAQSTRRRATKAAASRSKAPEIKKDESVQRAYSTRRSVRLLEKSMADLSLKTKEAPNDPSKNEQPESEAAAQEKNLAGATFEDNSERTEGMEAIPGRDLSATLETEWEMSDKCQEFENKSIQSDREMVNSEKNVNLGDISVFNAGPETYKEKLNETDPCLAENEAEEKDSKMNPVLEQYFQINNGESLQEKAFSPSKNMMIQNSVTEVPDHDASATNPMACKVLELDASQDEAIEDAESESDGNIGSSESERTETDSEVDPEEEDVSDADSNQAVLGSDVAVQDAEFNSFLGSKNLLVDQLEELDSDKIDDNESSESDQTESDLAEEDPEEEEEDCDSNQASFGSDIAIDVSANQQEDELKDSESEEDKKSESNKTEEAAPVSDKIKTPTSKSPFAAESVSGQFPRPNQSTPRKSSSKKQKSAPKLTIIADDNNNMDNKDKENSEREAEQTNKEEVKKEKKMFDEESLKDVSLRQLTKMVKELNIKKSNRTALQKLPDNNSNQTAEMN